MPTSWLYTQVEGGERSPQVEREKRGSMMKYAAIDTCYTWVLKTKKGFV